MVFELASAQRRAGADVQIWSPDAIRAGATEDHEGLPIRYFMPESAMGLAQSYGLERGISLLPPHSVLHAHNTFHPLNQQVGRAAYRYRHRAFYHPHGALDPVLLRGWHWKALKKRLYIAGFERPNLNAATGVFALTALEKQQITSLGVTVPIHVVPNGIHPVVVGSAADGAEFRKTHSIPPDARVMLFIGRIVPKKRVEDMIGVLCALSSSHPNLHLVVAGDPTQEPAYHAALLRRIGECGCAPRVRWVGFLNERTKPAAYAAAQVFLHASESEGMALAILEAMSAGLPVVATRGCYMGEAADAGALLQCEQGAAAIAEAVGQVLSGPSDLGSRGQAYVHRVHNWDALARRTLKLYEGK